VEFLPVTRDFSVAEAQNGVPFTDLNRVDWCLKVAASAVRFTEKKKTKNKLPQL
jgi:hypothetical protein